MYGEIKIFGGRANPSLTREICEYLNVPQGNSTAFNFSDGETFCQIDENVRGSDVFIVQPTCRPVNENLMELLILLDAFKRSSASRVTAVLPYYGYARQDKKDQPRVPITAKLVADLISRAGADRVLTMDLHAAQIQGFFDVPVDHMFAAPVLLDAIRELGIPDLVIVSPDAGGVERARAIAKRLEAGLAIVDKRRTAPNVAEIMHVIGDVAGKNVLILDDIVDTAGTLTKTVDALAAQGARRILAAGVHGILSGPALQRIEQSKLELVLITNTTPVEEKLQKCSKLKALSVAPLLGEAIRRIHENSSVSSLFV
ncbi:MAG: ribose-phosphate pyrophosphokinase [Acidobacteria bacterium]|nr:ribose-phosphate pyrophosphokinase [Acidobacteriota bacterium]